MKTMSAKMGALAMSAATLAGMGAGAVATASSAHASGAPIYRHLGTTYKGKGDCIVARDRETRIIMQHARIWHYAGNCWYNSDDGKHYAWVHTPIDYYSSKPIIKGDYRYWNN